MINDITLSAESIQIGEEVELRAFGDGPFYATVRCFVFEPKPPGYRECPECAVQKIEEGEPLLLRADLDTWRTMHGELRIEIADVKGNQRQVTLSVERREDSNSSPEAATAF